jgi:hypothetical protein
VGWVGKAGNAEDCPAALFGAVPLELADGLVLLLLFSEFASRVLLQVLVDTLLGLLAGLRLYLAGVDDELILHDDGHVADSQFGLVRFNQTQLYLIVFLKQFFVLSFAFELLTFLLGEIHGQHYPFILCANSHLLVKALTSNFIPRHHIFSSQS